MVKFEDALQILKNRHAYHNCEVLRFDFQYNNYHVFFFYKPTLIEDKGKDLFIFNADIDGIVISKPLYFFKNELITSIPKEIFFYFYKLSQKPTIFFEDLRRKILNNEINYDISNITQVRETHYNFIERFPNFKQDKPYFWRWTTARMSSFMEKKLRVNFNLSYHDISILKKSNKTAQFTYDPAKEKEFIITD